MKRISDLVGLTRYLQGPIYQSAKRLDGKVAYVTGANTGIGLQTANDLYRRGATVRILCRNLNKATKAVEDVTRASTSGDCGRIEVNQLDLGSMASIHNCAEKLLKEDSRLDLLVLNAGVMMSPLHPRTKDGFEMQMGTNHLGHFLLTRLLMSNLKRTGLETQDARIVTVSSVAHLFTTNRIRLHDLNWHKEKEFKPSQAYGQSKLANILFTKELARTLKGSGVTAYCLHPGVISTELDRHAKDSKEWIAYLDYLILYKMFGQVIKTPWHGAQTTLFCCLDDNIKHLSGAYFSDCKPTWSSWFTRNPDEAKKLWQLSEELTKCTNLEM